MDSSNSQYRVLQCFYCEESTVFVCIKCKQNLCDSCRKKHLHDLSTTQHETVVYRVNPGNINIEEMCRMHPENSYIFYCETCKLPVCYRCSEAHELSRHHLIQIYVACTGLRQIYRHIISTIRSEELVYRRALMVKMQSEIRTLSTKMSSHKQLSEMFTKAQKLKQFIDNVIHDRNKLFVLKNQILKSHIARIQKYEYIYEMSTNKPIRFLLFKMALSKIQSGQNLAQYSHFSLIESIIEKDVIRFICTYRLSGRDNRRLGNESLLELMPNPELQQCLTLTEIFGCSHISRVRPDQFWVSDNRTDLILFNANGDIQYHGNTIHVYTDVYDLTGAHTVNKNNDLIYIDRQNQIKLLSNTEINTLYITNKKDNEWVFRCVYSSLLSGDLLVGMNNTDSTCSKINRYHLLKELVQTIQHDNRGNDLYIGPCFITENANGDVIVSDWKNGVVVTDNEGKHRFTFSEDPNGSVISQKGICTDPLSHILVCVLHKVMMLDMDGQFISYILSMPPECMIVTNSLSFDSNTHCLWVGSVSSDTIRVYKYLKRVDALLGMYASDYYLNWQMFLFYVCEY